MMLISSQTFIHISLFELDAAGTRVSACSAACPPGRTWPSHSPCRSRRRAARPCLTGLQASTSGHNWEHLTRGYNNVTKICTKEPTILHVLVAVDEFPGGGAVLEHHHLVGQVTPVGSRRGGNEPEARLNLIG